MRSNQDVARWHRPLRFHPRQPKEDEETPTSLKGVQPAAEVDRGRCPGFPNFNVVTGGPGSSALTCDGQESPEDRKEYRAGARAMRPAGRRSYQVVLTNAARNHSGACAAGGGERRRVPAGAASSRARRVG